MEEVCTGDIVQCPKWGNLVEGSSCNWHSWTGSRECCLCITVEQKAATDNTNTAQCCQDKLLTGLYGSIRWVVELSCISATCSKCCLTVHCYQKERPYYSCVGVNRLPALFWIHFKTVLVFLKHSADWPLLTSHLLNPKISFRSLWCSYPKLLAGHRTTFFLTLEI